MRLTMNGWCRRSGAVLIAALFTLSAFPHNADAHDSWWSENFEVHGFFTSKVGFRSPGMSLYREIEPTRWRTELNLEMNFNNILNMNVGGDELSINGYAIVRPTFDAVYYINDDLYGQGLDKATSIADGGLTDAQNARASMQGRRYQPEFPGAPTPTVGGCLEKEFCINTGNTFFLYTGVNLPGVTISKQLFFGAVTAPWVPRSSLQTKAGGEAGSLEGSRLYQLAFGSSPLAGQPDLLNTMAMLGTTPGSLGNFVVGNDINGNPTGAGPLNGVAPLNWYQKGLEPALSGGFGDAKSFDKGFDINRRQHELELDCFDTAHPTCWLRELYADIEWGNLFIRLGRQQLSWGKTDAFRLQDKLNPLDVGYNNVFPDLEERRIPMLALDAIYSFGDVGPFQDVSFEFAWIFDRYMGDQAGQCGEPYAFGGLCHFRADIGGHPFFNFGSRSYDQVHWKLKNTEPWMRIEFRIPKPALSMSISAGWTFQDAPVARLIRGTEYSTSNPNPTVMPLLQALNFAPLIEDASDGVCDFCAGGAPAGPNVGNSPWTTGIDLYARTDDLSGPIRNYRGQNRGAGPDGILDPFGSLATANQLAVDAYRTIYNTLCSGASTDREIGNCIAGRGAAGQPAAADGGVMQFLGFMWTGGEDDILVPRVFTMGASLDYQIPNIDTILRLEFAMDFNTKVQDSSRRDFIGETHSVQAAIGLDRSTFIPFLNKNRTAFLSAQTFVNWLTNYNSGHGIGTIPYRLQVISTAFMQNYWRNDTLILTSFLAVLWEEQNIITGPSFRYVHNDNLFFDVGIQMLWGEKREHNITNMCGNGGTQYIGLGCAGDPDQWVPGQWQLLYEDLEMKDISSPGWAQMGVADMFQRNRDEIWFGVTYQF